MVRGIMDPRRVLVRSLLDVSRAAPGARRAGVTALSPVRYARAGREGRGRGPGSRCPHATPSDRGGPRSRPPADPPRPARGVESARSTRAERVRPTATGLWAYPPAGT